MLTVWRRLHIEVDSMGNVTGNLLTGLVTDVVPEPESRTTDVKVDPLLDAHRFEDGLLRDRGRRVVPRHSQPPLDCDAAGDSDGWAWTIRSSSGMTMISTAMIPIPLSSTGTTTRTSTAPSIRACCSTAAITASATIHSGSNVFGPRVRLPGIRPRHRQRRLRAVRPQHRRLDGSGKTSSKAALRQHWPLKPKTRTFWTVYLLSAYQNATAERLRTRILTKEGPCSSTREPLVGTAIDGRGALIFKETVADVNRLFDPSAHWLPPRP